MKRTASKRDNGLKVEDGAQQKISSFFQAGPAPAPSKLFTSVKRCKPPLTLKRQGSGTGPVPSAKPEKTLQSSSTKVSATVLKDCNSAPHHHHPEHKTPQKSESQPHSPHGSPDVVIIPDTPEDNLGKRRPKPANRSFLCSVAQLSTLPGKKPTPPTLKQRKVVKKSLGPVSVEFGPKKLSAGEEKVKDENSASADLKHGETENSVGNFRDPVDYADFPFDVDHEWTSSVQSRESCADQNETRMGTQDLERGVTPTKLSNDGKSIKRMAHAGLSPDPKRSFVTEIAPPGDSDISEPTTSQRKLKAKKKLASLTGFKDVKEMNQLVNNYQLGGKTRGSDRAGVSCQGDDVLADILGQISGALTSQEKKSEKVHNQEQNVPVVSQKLPDLSSVSAQEDNVKDESILGAEDGDVLDEILSELGSGACPEQKTDIPQLSSKAKDNHKRTPIQLVERDKKATEKETEETVVSSKVDIPQEKECRMDTEAEGGAHEKRKHPENTGKGAELESSDQAMVHSTLSEMTRPTTPTRGKNINMHAELDEELVGSFGQLSPFKTTHIARGTNCGPPAQPSKVKFTDKWNRFVVHNASYDSRSHETTLTLSKVGEKEASQKAILRGFWSDTHLEAGDIVHLLLESGRHLADNDDSGDADVIVIDDSQGQLVVNPDLLLSGTAIVSGVYCLRRSVLNEKFKGVDSKNAHMLYGSIIHSLFQEVLKDRLCKTEEIMAVAKSIVQSNKFLHDMYGQCVAEGKVMEEIQAYIGPLQTWFNKHVPSTHLTTNRSAADVRVVQIHDIEETIWSPRIGVKGKIDMTVEVEIQKERGQVRRKVLPLELKTGRASHSAEHKGQVTLYSMMMSDRRDNPEEGLLLYLKHNDMSTVPVKSENTRGLLQLRNEMAYYLSRQARKCVGDDGHVTYQLGRLPPPINSLRSCSKCPQLVNCAIYQRSVENERHSADHAMSSLVPDTLSHLSESHLTYFTHWLLCMDLEAASQRSEGLRSIWCMSSSEREERGDCLQQMVIVDSVLGVPETQAFSEGKGCCVQFQRKPGFCGGALNTSGLGTKDSVVISSEDGQYIALSTGFIRNITETVVDIVVDRDSFHENTAFQSVVFRIDRCDAFNTSGFLLTSLSRLMDSSPHSQKLRSLIVDGRKPEFQLTMSKSAVEKVKKIFKPLNKPQKTAILKVLMSKDFVLIKGYPGTGKTSTIVALVKILQELGQSVLLTSYTHSAVDNILLKLKKDGVPFLRLGRSSRIHPDILDHAAETLTLDITSVDSLRDFYASYGIVATSCLGVNHPVFTQRRFDVCIVDEASQVLQPACLGPLFHADRFVLVGDPQQLPPVVQSREASSLGMGESLFARLDGAGATYDLHLQYRMNSPIMQLSNELVYQGALRCGDTIVSQACIQPSPLSPANDAEWMGRCLDASLTSAVVFLDTCQMSAPEVSDSRGHTNAVETNLVFTLCTTFLQAGIAASDMGVIAPYRAQVRALQQKLWEWSSLKGVEVNTVDQYQGRDKSVIVISFVRSSSSSQEESQKRGLLEDVRRLNVAVTRAKHKLVLVGNSCTLSRYQPLNTLLNNLRSRQQIFVLPADLQLEDCMDV